MITKSFTPRQSHLLVFDREEDVLAELSRFAQEHGIRGGWFVALGAFRSATIAWWNPSTKEYERIEVAEQVEVLSMIGNIGHSGSETKLHAHVTLGRRDGSAVCGHLLHATAFPTIEMHVIDYGVDVERRQDAETGLWLLNARP